MTYLQPADSIITRKDINTKILYATTEKNNPAISDFIALLVLRVIAIAIVS